MNGPDVTAVKVYKPQEEQIQIHQEEQIQVHQSRVVPCPPELPAGFYWYGDKRSGPGGPPRWVEKLLQGTIPPTSLGSMKCKFCTRDRNRDRKRNVPGDPAHFDSHTEEGVQESTVSHAEKTTTTTAEEIDSESIETGALENSIAGRNVLLPPELESIDPRKANPPSAKGPSSRLHRRTGLRQKTTPPDRLMWISTQPEDKLFLGGE